jgi:hypothetical protein
MIRMTLRTLLAYLDDTLPPADAKVIGEKLAESKHAQELVEKIRKGTRKRGLSTPPGGPENWASDPNVVAAYLSDKLSAEQVTEFEKVALQSDVHLADVAACHQILTLLLSEQLRVPPTAYRRMYGLVKGKESIPGRSPGKTIPVGGVRPSESASDGDDADANYLLGMSAYSREQPFAQKALRWAAAAALAVGFAVAGWLAWPKTTSVDAGVNGYETAGNRKAAIPPPTDPKADDTPKPQPMDPQPQQQPAVEPMPMPKPDVTPKSDVAPPPPPPRNDRLVVAKLDTPDGKVVLAKKTDDPWSRVAKGADLYAADRLLCPPGYAAKLTAPTGTTIELWGNVFPDLLPIPVHETIVTPHVPPDGFDADFTLHTGRVYLTAGRPSTAVRVRFREEVWDVTLPDAQSEAVVQVVHMPVPGTLAEPPRTVAAVHVMKGTANLTVRFKTFDKVAAGELIDWDSKVGKPAGPKKPDGQFGKDSAYFNKVPVYPSPKAAQPMLQALDQFAERLKPGTPAQAAFAELRADPTAGVSSAYLAGGRFSVFASAAVGDLAAVADVLNDANRPDLRVAAVTALQHHLADQPDAEEKFRTLAREKLRLSDDGVTVLLRHLRGVGPDDRTDLTTLNRLVDQLTAAEIAQREVALYVLLTDVDPTARSRPTLVFDCAAGADVREAAKAAWQQRVKEIAAEKK